MSDHLVFSQHMTGAEYDDKVRHTFLGQAHFAGTGPDGKTCRECAKWHKSFKKPSAAYNADKHKSAPRELKRARCIHPIRNKAKRLIPHDAGACVFFDQSDNPLPTMNPVEPKPKRQRKKRK